MISFMLDAVIARSIMKIFSNNLFISTLSSLIIIRLNLVNNASNGLVSIKFSQVEFHFELCALKSLISIILFIMILF